MCWSNGLQAAIAIVAAAGDPPVADTERASPRDAGDRHDTVEPERAALVLGH